MSWCVLSLNHRSFRSSTTRRRRGPPKPLVRIRTPAGTTDLSSPASLTTRRRRTAASEDECMLLCVQLHHIAVGCSHSPPAAVRMIVCAACTCAPLHVYMCVCAHIHAAGLNVPVVSSSFTGNLHPTPCIEWMQGKRGDPGCMAKAWSHASQCVIAVCALCSLVDAHTS